MEHAQMADVEHDPAAMLEAAMNGTLELDSPTDLKAVEEDKQVEAKDAPKTDAPKVETPAKADDEPQGAPIASKSGAYTIPYEKLAQAREHAKTVEAENEALKAQLADLNGRQQQNLTQAQEQAQARAEAGQAQTKADKDLNAAQSALSTGVDPAIFGDFTEEGIAKGIQTLMSQARAEMKAEMEKELAPLKTERAKAVTDTHMGSIYAKHADADEVAESTQFKQWFAGLPSFMRAGVKDAMENGTAEQVIEVFDSFKAQAVGIKPPPATTTKPDVQRRVPASLTEINGAPPMDETQRVLQMSNDPGALLDAMNNMTPEQVKALMDRV